jgi:hypothetical protein
MMPNLSSSLIDVLIKANTPLWQLKDGAPLTCLEKRAYLEQAYREIAQLLADFLLDAGAMNVEITHIVQNLEKYLQDVISKMHA